MDGGGGKGTKKWGGWVLQLPIKGGKNNTRVMPEKRGVWKG